MSSVADRIAQVIVSRLELESYTAETLPRDAILFAPPESQGLDLDSIASLEIISGLSDEFDLPFDDVQRDDMMSVNTLAAYVTRQLSSGAAA
jgi:acyl carrier protein